MMDCPRCHTAMLTYEYEGLEVDECVQCKGVWLDHEELELLLGSTAAADEFVACLARLPVDNKGIPCPRCRKAMLEVHPPDSPALHVDLCRKNHGVWFDEGELGQLMTLPQLPWHPQLKSRLQDLFAGPGPASGPATATQGT